MHEKTGQQPLDRTAGALRVLGSFTEPGQDHRKVAQALAVELRSMAGWLGLADVVVAPRGDLAAALETALG